MSLTTPRASDLGTHLISVPFNSSASESTSCLILPGWPIVMYSDLAVLGPNLIVLLLLRIFKVSPSRMLEKAFL